MKNKNKLQINLQNAFDKFLKVLLNIHYVTSTCLRQAPPQSHFYHPQSPSAAAAASSPCAARLWTSSDLRLDYIDNSHDSDFVVKRFQVFQNIVW